MRLKHRCVSTFSRPLAVQHTRHYSPLPLLSPVQNSVELTKVFNRNCATTCTTVVRPNSQCAVINDESRTLRALAPLRETGSRLLIHR